MDFSDTATHASHASVSGFRNVSACSRCRARKNRCDQNLPACSLCQKAGVRCVGYDPVLKRAIPRNYVWHIEKRLEYLENLLTENGIDFAPADDVINGTGLDGDEVSDLVAKAEPKSSQSPLSTVSHTRALVSAPGPSFASVVYAAMRTSVGATPDKNGHKSLKRKLSSTGQSLTQETMRDSFFGMQGKSSYQPAPRPSYDLAKELSNYYFQYANPQIPILHRVEFDLILERVYHPPVPDRQPTPRELYMLNIVFAIGSGIIFDANATEKVGFDEDGDQTASDKNRFRTSSKQHQPEEYHAAAVSSAESFFTSSPTNDLGDGYGAILEELKAYLLLASFALLRPVRPGLWYIAGRAMRLAVDLGLHFEEGAGLETTSSMTTRQGGDNTGVGMHIVPVGPEEKGRREWIRDMRRRLWWCTYAIDRLVSSCVGRPVGISDQAITTEFPSLLRDEFITTSGFKAPPDADTMPSDKRVSSHYVRFRNIQSEILEVLQYRHAQEARRRKYQSSDKPIKDLRLVRLQTKSAVLADFDYNFREWREDIERRLLEWKDSAPTQAETGVEFSVQFLELNYWQALLMLYRQSLSAPRELSTGASANGYLYDPLQDFGIKKASAGPPRDEDHDFDDGFVEEPEDYNAIYLKVAEAGQKVLYLYQELFDDSVVNYTYLATHHIFMAGIGFLYAIWHSTNVRRKLTYERVRAVCGAATLVLNGLSGKCPPAKACKDAFERMTTETIKMCQKSTGFGQDATDAVVATDRTKSRPINAGRPISEARLQAETQAGSSRQVNASQSPESRLPHSESSRSIPPETLIMNIARETLANLQARVFVSVPPATLAGSHNAARSPTSSQPMYMNDDVSMSPTAASLPSWNYTEANGVPSGSPSSLQPEYTSQSFDGIPYPPDGSDNYFQTLLANDQGLTYGDQQYLGIGGTGYEAQPGLDFGLQSQHDFGDQRGLGMLGSFFFGDGEITQFDETNDEMQS